MGALEHDSDPPTGGGHCQVRPRPRERMCWSRLDRGATVLMGPANSLLLQVTEGAKDVRRASSKTQQASSGQTPRILEPGYSSYSRELPVVQRAAAGREVWGCCGASGGSGRAHGDAASGWESPTVDYRPATEQSSDTCHDMAIHDPGGHGASGKQSERKGHIWYDSTGTDRAVCTDPHGEKAACWLPGPAGQAGGTGGDSQGGTFLLEVMETF